MLTVLDLFSGIGGISLGLERAGLKTVAFCEIEKFQRAVLAHHWPEVPRYDDIAKLSAETLRRDGIHGCDVIAGGFPCQDISVAGKGAGIENGERSGLWREMHRLICEMRPTWVLAENVSALRTRGADRVISDLEAADYTVEPLVVGAWAVGAPHKRDRVWIVAHAKQNGSTGAAGRGGFVGAAGEESARANDAFDSKRASVPPATFGDVAHPEQVRRPEGRGIAGDESGQRVGWSPSMEISERIGRRGRDNGSSEEAGRGESETEDRRPDMEWPARPGEPQRAWEEPRLLKWPMGASADGLSERLVRFANRNTLGAAGNSVVPQVVEMIGRAIVNFERGC